MITVLSWNTHYPHLQGYLTCLIFFLLHECLFKVHFHGSSSTRHVNIIVLQMFSSSRHPLDNLIKTHVFYYNQCIDDIQIHLFSWNPLLSSRLFRFKIVKTIFLSLPHTNKYSILSWTICLFQKSSSLLIPHLPSWHTQSISKSPSLHLQNTSATQPLLF